MFLLTLAEAFKSNQNDFKCHVGILCNYVGTFAYKMLFFLYFLKLEVCLF